MIQLSWKAGIFLTHQIFKNKNVKIFMKKLLLLVVIAVFAAANSNAQKGTGVGRPSLSIGVDGALPLGDFKEGSNFGIGGTLKGALPVAKDLDVTLTTGFISFSG